MTMTQGSGATAAPPSIQTPGSIWAELVNAHGQKVPDGSDAHVYFLGARGSGKSTLMQRYLYPSKVAPANRITAGDPVWGTILRCVFLHMGLFAMSTAGSATTPVNLLCSPS